MAKCLSCSEISGTEWYASVAPKEFGWTENNNSVWPCSPQRKHLSPQLTRLVRSLKDLQGINWMICNELDAGNAEQTKKKEELNLDEVFFERGNKHAWDKCKSTEKNTRELHLELVGDKVTYVRVYWLRVKWDHLIIGHTHRLSSKWGCHFSFKHLDVFTYCRVALTHVLE